MKRKKTRPPQAASGDIQEIRVQLRQMASDKSKRYQIAEAARAVYDKAEQLHRQFPQDSEASNAYFAAQEYYWQCLHTAYSHELRRDIDLLRNGDAAGLETIILFLEADPLFYGTGYLKEDLSRFLRRAELPGNYVQRLQKVVLSIVDRRDGREFRAYCRLARKVDSTEFREQLRLRLTREKPTAASLTADCPSLLPAIQQDKNVRRRARWVLEALGEKIP